MNWQRRTEIIGGVPFTSFEPVPVSGGPPDFDGGCRQLLPTPPRVEWERDQADSAWVSTTIEDGASLFFGTLGE
jgi:hypothetical protein